MDRIKNFKSHLAKVFKNNNEIPRSINVVTSCDPQGYDCETCFHLGPTASSSRFPVDDLCFITPKSLERPLAYTKHYLRGTPKKTVYPTSQITGTMKEVKLDKVKEPPCDDCGQGQRTRLNDGILKSHQIYVEHNGKFTKAPRHLVESGDFALRECFLEDTDSPTSGSPLELAIMVQKMWTPLAKILQGILAGVALLESLLVKGLFIRAEVEDLGEVFEVYTYLDATITCIFQVFLIVILIALLDWIDLYHLDIRHLWDTFAWRKVWLLLAIYLLGFILLTVTAPANDAFVLHSTRSTFKINEHLLADPEWFTYLYQWRHICLVKDTLVIVGWIMVVLIGVDDLFLEHLMSMKKFDYETTSPKMEDIKLEFLPQSTDEWSCKCGGEPPIK